MKGVRTHPVMIKSATRKIMSCAECLCFVISSNFSELGWAMEGPTLSCVWRERAGEEGGGEERERRRGKGQINTCITANTHIHTHKHTHTHTHTLPYQITRREQKLPLASTATLPQGPPSTAAPSKTRGGTAEKKRAISTR